MTEARLVCVPMNESSDASTTIDDELLLALLGPRAAGGPRRSVRQLQLGRQHLQALVMQLSEEDRDSAYSTAARLRESGVRALLCDDPRYPDRLRRFRGAPPALFYRGPLDLLEKLSVGVCGSRNASDAGLRAARACGEDAARLDISVTSGYAKGVDTESHLACLSTGGHTVAVLAEGIDHFRIRAEYRELGESVQQRLLVISQFPPTQRWTAGAAMTRNQVIVGLSHAVLVVEAGETGGTLRAGEIALQGERPLMVLRFPDGNLPGNERLLAAGARPVTNRVELSNELRRLGTEPGTQLTLD